MTRPRRALLFVPGDDRRKIGKAIAAGADAVILDLEDGVALNRKDAARAVTAAALAELDFGRAEKLVRINAVGSSLEAADVAAVLPARPDGVVIPKVEAAEQVAWVRSQIPAPEGLALLAIVETARGIANLNQIAAAPGLAALAFGAEDFVGSVGGIRTAEGREVFFARSVLVLHAAACGLPAIDTPFLDLRDEAEAALRAEARAALELGYGGKLVIHPKHIAPILDIFTPSPDEVARAARLVQAYADHQASGSGVFAFEGRMIDAPVIRAARAVLARANLK